MSTSSDRASDRISKLIPESAPPVVVPGNDVPKKRRTRGASNFLILRKAEVDVKETKEMLFPLGSATTIKAALKKIIDDKLTGELLIVCVRRRLTASIIQQVVLEKS